MDKFKKSFSMRKKKEPSSTTEFNKPHQWQEDEKKVREGSCSFQVKYLGCIEVFESRGIQVCEEAVKALKSRKHRSIWSRLSMRKKKQDSNSPQSKSGHHMAVLYVTGDALRVVDEISKGLIVDQTIEKVSFCAPDRYHDKGFAYICRDGTTRRWMCHGFLAVKESGERLSHAVGCAFAVCLEKKQQREKEKVNVTYSENGTSFTRLGSFRQATVTERLADPQSTIVAEPVPAKHSSNPYAVQRPHAPVDLLERQGSFRNFEKLAVSSPFKRNISLRLSKLPSTVERQKQFGLDGPEITNNANVISTIDESEELDPLSPLSDIFNQINLPNQNPSSNQVNNITLNQVTGQNQINLYSTNQNLVQNQVSNLSINQNLIQNQSTNQNMGLNQAKLVTNNNQFNFSSNQEIKEDVTSLNQKAIQATNFTKPSPANNSSSILKAALSQTMPVHQTNPWASETQKQNYTTSEAETWLSTTANHIDPFAAAPRPAKSLTNGFNAASPLVSENYVSQNAINVTQSNNVTNTMVVPQHQYPMTHIPTYGFVAGYAPEQVYGVNFNQTFVNQVGYNQMNINHNAFQKGYAADVTARQNVVANVPPGDPFDLSWARAGGQSAPNPFQNDQHPTFKLMI